MTLINAKKKVFLICPVRNVTEEYKTGLESQVKWLEEKYDVYYPARDTNQVDPTGGYQICQDNLKAIKDADIVYIAWDGKSTGSLFDLGMAFALGKPIRSIIGYMPAMTKQKSFQNMIYYWEENANKDRS